MTTESSARAVDTGDTPDEALMLRFVTDLHELSFQEIVARHNCQALAVAHHYMRDTHLSEDAVQETFLHVIRKRHNYRIDMPFAPWFYTLLRNVCLDMLRRKARRNAFTAQWATHQPTEAPPHSAPDVSVEVIDRLPTREREVLRLRVVEDMGFDEIAAALGCSAEAAKKRAQRGLARLRKVLDRQRDG